MRRRLALAALALAAAIAPAAAQSTHVEVGILNCTVSGGAGFIFGSSKSLDCAFDKANGGTERYHGTIKRYGIDLGVTQKSVITWAVLAPLSDVAPGALSGNYAGVSGEATVGVGLGANALVGGSKDSIALQPLSVQAQQGLNVAVGIAALSLRAGG